MTSTLLKQVERLRYLAILLFSLCAFATANAQLESDDISAAILQSSPVAIRWTNDAEHSWYLATDEYGSYMRTPDIPEEDTEMTSTLSFSYSSEYPTAINWDWYKYSYHNDDPLSLFVDGEEVHNIGNHGWHNGQRYTKVPAGSHTIEFVSVSRRGNYDYDTYYAAIRDICITEYKALETECLKDGSLPLTFQNDPNYEWLTEDGCISSNSQYYSYASSSISTTFTIDAPSLFSFEWNESQNDLYNYYYGDTYNTTKITIDGVEYISSSNKGSWQQEAVMLYPGEHTVEFNNTHGNSIFSYDSDYKYWRSSGAWTRIRNVSLDQNWYEVTLNNPGELGTRLTQVLEGKPIQDMELLKINGAMNSDDWSSVKLLTGIKAIDFSMTGLKNIPASACENLQYLNSVILPETLIEIGDKAFKGTNFYQVSIPASVEVIGSEVWSETPLRYISFAEDSKLSYIGNRTFYKTRIMEFDMPDSVETLGEYYHNEHYSYQYDYYDGAYQTYMSSLFEKCSYLKRLHLSTKLKVVPGLIASGCTSLEEVNLPVNAEHINYYAFSNTALKSIDIPESMNYIGRGAFNGSTIESVKIPKNVTAIYIGAFSNCKNLKEVYLNSHCWDMDYTFGNCTALEKVVLPCATPPTISDDPFSGVTKSQVTLVVPDFAFDTYRANSYWYNFTNTVKGDEASINDYWAIRGTLNLNNTLAMQGQPSVEIMEGGILTLDSDSSQTFNEFTYNTSEGKPSVVLSQSNSVSAGRIVSKFFVSYADEWYFFSPITDVKMSEVSYPATDSWVIRYYDGARRASEDATSGNWINVPADGTLKAGQGYIIQARARGWLYLPAASTAENDKFFGANAVTFDLADNACETEANAGWNFVANPYPTYYDIYYIDMQAPITVWDGSTYRAYSLNDGDRGDDTFVLRPMQPFFVQKSAETPDLSTGMPLVGRQVNTTIDRTRAPRPVVKDENRQKLNLELYCNDNETADDYTRVVLNEQASLAYETVRDASKFMSMDANVAQLYTLGDNNHPMAINERPYEDGNVALGVLLPTTDRTYRIAALRADRQAWLYDAETGMEFDLTEGDYIFSASKTGIDNKRFSIRFAPASTTSVDGINETVKVAGNVGSISVTAPVGAAVAVFGTDGSIITNATAENGTLEISVAGGVYVVKVNGESFKTIVK